MRKCRVLITVLFFVSLVLNVILFRQGCRFNEVVRKVVVDTIKFEKPVAKDSTIIRYITKSIAVNGRSDIAVTPVGETDNLCDSAVVSIPITQKIYEDSLYKAYVSGYAVSLDSIFVNRFTEHINIRSPTSKQKMFGVGIHTGVGLTPQGFQPYVGIGIDIRLFSF